jgi:hypothetical protein
MVATFGRRGRRAQVGRGYANDVSSSRKPRRLPCALALGFVAFAAAGCYSLSEPSFAPGDQRDVLRSITRRGIVVGEAMPGDAACADPDLIGNVLHLTARLPDESEARDVYIHGYRERSWEGSKAEVDTCQAEYAAAHPGSAIGRLDVPTWRVFGADWSAELTTDLRAALEEASQAGR